MRDGSQGRIGMAGAPRARADLRVRVEEPGATERVAQQVAHSLGRLGRPGLAILCIGTDRSTGDALGPLVGTLLTRGEALRETQVRVLGTLDEPVHAGNLERVLAGLAAERSSTTVVAIDACLGRSENVGSISVGTGPLQPGAGVNKTLPPVGDLFVTGTVNVGGFMEYFVLQNTRLSLVMRMAEIIASGLAAGVAAFLAAREAAAGRGSAG
ncbi:MAG: spore protease YyaC [Bacillota bacterium]